MRKLSHQLLAFIPIAKRFAWPIILWLKNHWKWIVLLIFLILLPPLLFQLVFIRTNIGKIPIAPPTRCGGEYRMSLPYGQVGRTYEDDCINRVKFNVEDISSRREFSQILTSLNDLLRYKICFDARTTLDNSDNIPESETTKTIILEEWNKFPREIRFEDVTKNGFDISEGGCATIPDWATGTMTINPWGHIAHKVDERLFNKLVDEGFLSEMLDQKDVFKNKFFVEDAEIYAIPEYIGFFVFIGLTVAWLFVLGVFFSLTVNLRKLIGRG
jgi:hypothetical protein